MYYLADMGTNEVLELIAEENEELRDEINIKLTSNSKLSDEVLNLESMISGINTKNTATSLTRDEIRVTQLMTT